MPFSRKSLSVLLASSLLFSGCISSKRMERISPLSESDGTRMSASRTNAYPLYYGTGAGFSVLWPFLDFDEKGWAFRPFYAQEGNEHSVLWPLSGWDQKGGWALTGYWKNDQAFGVFPLFHISENETGGRAGDFNYVFPFWWLNDRSDWGMFPLGGVGNNDWRLLNFYYKNTDKHAHWNFWPILYRESNVGRDSVDWRLLYGVLSGYEDNKSETAAWLFPLFWIWSDKDSDDYTAWVFPTFLGKREDNVSLNTLLPFYFYTGRGNGDYAFITPIGWHTEKGNSETTAILPLYYYSTRGNDNYVFATALGGWGKFSDGGHLHYALGSLYIDYTSPSENYAFESVLWPLYMHSRDGNEESTYLFPFGHRWTDGTESRRGFLLGLGATRSRDNKTSWAIWPFYALRNDFGDADFRYWLTLGGSKENSACKESSNWLFPLYHYVDNGKDDYEFYSLCYLFGIENSYRNYNHARRFENYLFPLYFYDSWTKCNETGVPVTGEPFSREFMIPLVYGFESNGITPKSREHWALLNLLNFKEKNYDAIPLVKTAERQSLATKSTRRVINTIWETRKFCVWKNGVLSEYEQKIIEFALAVHHHGWNPRGCIHMRSRESFTPNIYGDAFDREIFGTQNPHDKYEWSEVEKARKNFAQKELSKILKNKGIDVPENADAPFLILALQKFVAKNSEMLTEKEFEVWPFYKAKDDAFGGYEKELLWGLWYSRGNADESFTSCAKYLYRRETTKDGTKLDVFPFISVDTGKRSAFSFLGNFFKIVNDDEKGWSGNVLFIPWGKR